MELELGVAEGEWFPGDLKLGSESDHGGSQGIRFGRGAVLRTGNGGGFGVEVQWGLGRRYGMPPDCSVEGIESLESRESVLRGGIGSSREVQWTSESDRQSGEYMEFSNKDQPRSEFGSGMYSTQCSSCLVS